MEGSPHGGIERYWDDVDTCSFLIHFSIKQILSTIRNLFVLEALRDGSEHWVLLCLCFPGGQ